MEKVGLVTITYNSEKVLQGFLNSVFIQTHDLFVLYVIDNNSEDKTLEMLAAYDDHRIKMIRNTQNIGVAAANNQGIKLALNDGCDQVLILNNDIEFSKELIQKMLQVQKDQKCSLVAPKIMYYDNPQYIWYAGSKFDKKKGYLPLHRGLKEKDNGQYDGVEKSEYAPTCCLLVQKDVFEDVGFMDERYFVYFDDTDFLYRVFIQGKHTLSYFSDSNVYHKIGSLSKSLQTHRGKEYRGDFFLQQNTRNHVFFLKKIGTVYAWLFIYFLFFKNNIRFIINPNIKKDFKTWILINKSYFQGLMM